MVDYYGDGDMYLVPRSNGAGGSQSITATAIAAGGMTNDPEDYTGFGPEPRSDTGADATITIVGVGASVSSTATIMRITVNSPGADVDGLQFEIDNTLLGLDPIYTQPAPRRVPPYRVARVDSMSARR